MRGGGIFTNEFGSLSGEPVIDTKKQMACADSCGAKYQNDPINYNICYGQCWTSALTTGDGSTPGTTTPGTTTPTTNTTKCTDGCAQYPMFSLDFIKCQAGCAGIGGGAVPAIPGGGLTPGGGGTTVTPGTGTAASGTNPWLIAGVLGAIGLGAYYMLGKKKSGMTPNRRRRGRR